MKATKKVKFIIFLATLIIITLFTTVIVQVVKINIAENKISKQQQQIELLEKELDSYEKNPDTNFEPVS